MRNLQHIDFTEDLKILRKKSHRWIFRRPNNCFTGSAKDTTFFLDKKFVFILFVFLGSKTMKQKFLADNLGELFSVNDIKYDLNSVDVWNSLTEFDLNYSQDNILIQYFAKSLSPLIFAYMTTKSAALHQHIPFLALPSMVCTIPCHPRRHIKFIHLWRL